MNLSINQDYSTLYDGSGIIKNKTSDFLGNIVSMLEKEFPDVSKNNPGFFLSDLVSEINGTPTKAKTVWGFKERGTALLHFYDFIDSRKQPFYPTMLDVERLRISNSIKASPDVSPAGSVQCNVQSVFHAIYVMLYFYAYNGLGMKQCTFCGKWFTVDKESAQAAYCSRAFHYTDCKGKAHYYNSCLEAQERIWDRSRKRYRAIYDRLYHWEGASEKTNSLATACDRYRKEAKDNRSFENLQRYENFLYTDCDKPSSVFNIT